MFVLGRMYNIKIRVVKSVFEEKQVRYAGKVNAANQNGNYTLLFERTKLTEGQKTTLAVSEWLILPVVE